jgi:hypothetical protein
MAPGPELLPLYYDADDVFNTSGDGSGTLSTADSVMRS